MAKNLSSPEDYIAQIEPERRAAISELRKTIRAALPTQFSEAITYGMISYVVPHSVYPAGYHCDAAQPLPFISIASQKSHIALYHMGMYANPELLNWFVSEYTKITGRKPDIGKSCVRFKKPDQIPFELIGKLVGKMSAKQWISLYEEAFKKGKK